MQKKSTKPLNGKRFKDFGNEPEILDEDEQNEFEQIPQKKVKQSREGIKKKSNQQDHSQKESKHAKTGKKDHLKFDELNKLYNQLMNTKTKNGRSKKEIVDDVLRLTSGILPQIATKHDGCRVIQGCLKHGTQEQIQQIINVFINNQLPELARSKYGHHLPIKMIKHLNKKQLNQCLEYLMKSLDLVATSPEGAQTLAAFIKAGGSKSIVDQYLAPIINIKIEDATTHEKLENTALKIVEKKAYHYPLQQQILAESLRVLIPEEREKIIEAVVNDFQSFLFTKEGVNLVCNSLDLMQPKDKKQILKGFKSKVTEFLTAENSLCHVVIIKIFNSVDDTVAIKKNIINEINKNLEELVSKSHVNEILLSIYDSEEDYLSKYVKKISSITTSKKDTETRNKELIEYTIEPLVNLFSFQLGEYIASPKYSKLLFAVMKNILQENREEYFKLIDTAVDTIIENYNKSDKASDLENNVLVSHTLGHRFLKHLITNYQNYNGEAKQYYGEVIEKIYEFIVKELPILLPTKAIFIIIALIERTDYNSQIIQEINQYKHVLKNLKGTGAEILKNLL